MGHWTESGSKTIAKVVDIKTDRVTMLDQTGGVVDALFLFGLPSVPEVGQRWLIEKLSHGVYMLDRLIGDYGISKTEWTLMVDSQDLMNSADVVIKNALLWGFDSIVIPACGNGMAYWDSSVAESLGMDIGADIITDTLLFARESGMKVYGYFSESCLPASMTQRRYLSGTYGEFVSFAQTSSYSPVFKDELSSLVEDLYAHHDIDGLLFYVGYESYASDHRVVVEYFQERGEYPPLPSKDGWMTEEEWSWEEYRDSWWTEVLVSVANATPEGKRTLSHSSQSQWIAEPIADVVSLGRVSYGISSDVLSLSGVPCLPTFSGVDVDTVADEVLVCEWNMSISENVSDGRCIFWFDDVDVAKGAIASVSDYDIKQCVVGCYSWWAGMEESDRRDCLSHMEPLRVGAGISPSDSIGIVLSIDSRDSSYGLHSAVIEPLVNGVDYQRMVQQQFLQLRKYVRGIKTRVLLDSDISSPPVDVRCLILPGVASLSDESISSVLSWGSRGDKSLVVVGASGVYEARSNELKSEFPLQSAFGFDVEDVGSIGSWDVSFPVDAPILQGKSFGSANRFGARRLESPGVYDATMFFSTIDRSAFFNPDMFFDGGIDDVIWRLAAFGVSRGVVVASDTPDIGFDKDIGHPSAAYPALPAGAIQMFALSSPPDGWLVCDGSNVSRGTYRRLFDAIGTTFGNGNGTSTFTLPDLKGRVIVGVDDDDVSFDTLGDSGGSKVHTLTEGEMPSHSHTYTRYNTLYSFAQAVATPGIPNVMYNTSTQSSGVVGSGLPHNNLQPYMVMLPCIKT